MYVRFTILTNNIETNPLLFYKFTFLMNNIDNVEPDVVVAKKRGRKKNVIVTDPDSTLPIDEVKPIKKRGRKPKGGKIILSQSINADNETHMSNVILHLKCSSRDLHEHNSKQIQLVSDPGEYVPIAPPNIITYNSSIEHNFGNYTECDDNNNAKNDIIPNAYNTCQPKSLDNICKSCNEKYNDNVYRELIDDTTSMDEINNKIKQLKLQLYNSNSYDKKSACFWCTCEYDNQTCYIPKHELNGELCGYGAFCRPECAVAFLLKENIDDSDKYDRYQLINMVYGKVNDYKTNIKPSIDPHYTLSKFYGNLSIQEYRKLLNNEHLLAVIDKPMTRILPELHDDLDGTIDNISSVKQTAGFKVKRQSEKPIGRSKSSIMKERFGIE